MNAGLTRWQVEDILAASEEADVPAGAMLRAAEDIRAAFLGPAIDSSRRTSEVVSPIRVRRQTRRARTRVAAVCAATLSVAALLGAANAGALPTVVERPVARVAGLIGIKLPEVDGGGPGVDAERTPRPSSSADIDASTASPLQATASSEQTPHTATTTNSGSDAHGGGTPSSGGTGGESSAPNGNGTESSRAGGNGDANGINTGNASGNNGNANNGTGTGAGAGANGALNGNSNANRARIPDSAPEGTTEGG